MTPYWVAYALPAFLALVRLRVTTTGWSILSGLLVVFIGLRYRVGADWGNYIRGYFSRSSGQTFFETLTDSDPAFMALNWVTTHLGLGIWVVNLLVAIIFIVGLIRFVRKLPEPLVALTVAIPYVAVVVAMNYTRQAAAIGVLLWALVELYDRRLLRYVIWVFVAACFHKSAVAFLPLVAFSKSRGPISISLISAAALAIGYVTVLAEKFQSFWSVYVDSEYSQAAQGAPVRVAMTALPAAAFLVFRNRFDLHPVERRVWTAISFVSIAMMALVFAAPTAVDRAALYFSPLQFLFASYACTLIRGNDRIILRLAIIGLYAMVFYVWLNYAQNAHYWYPYRLWPFWEHGVGMPGL